MKAKKKVVYLEWEDAHATENGWYYESEALKWATDTDATCKQAGFLIKETPKYLLFAMAIYPSVGLEGERYGNLMKIPKTWIRNRKELKI